MKPTVLVIDDEEAIRSSLRMILEYEGYLVLDAGSGREGIRLAQAERPDAILLDIKMPRMDGLEVLPVLRQELASVPVVVISGHGTIQTAVEALRAGASDFLEKPLGREVVLHRLARVLEHRKLREEVDALRLQYDERYRILGDSPAMAPVRQAIARAAPTRASVLVTGESGVGKELVARAIHRNSARKQGPFIRVNCAAIPEDLIESELFGHEKGSFTGASRDQVGKFVQANGGTIFLDEIGDMSLKTQAKVLRVLQDGEVEPVGAAKPFTVDVRVIAATNHDLPAAIAKGQFREDLFYRLNVLPIRVPPLRERPTDVPILTQEFAEAFRRENGTRERTFTSGALAWLSRLSWTGNVRELKNAVERVLILADADPIDAPDLERVLEAASLPGGARHAGQLGDAAGQEAGRPGDDPLQGSAPPAGIAGTPAGLVTSLQDFKDAAERAFIVRKLRENDWNITQTARAIDTPRSNLYKKLEQYGISREKDDPA